MSGIKRCFISQVQPGMRLARALYMETGMVLLEEETILTDSLIRRLSLLGIQELFVFEERLFFPPVILQNEQNLFVEEHRKITTSMAEAFYKARQFQCVPMCQISCLADQIIASLLSVPGVFSYLHIINSHDDYTFRHSVNVAVTAGVIGRCLGKSKETIKGLVIAGLLHDIGKARIPLEILNKPDRLTEAEMAIMQKHSMFGYELLVGTDDMPGSIKTAILQHHERSDGSGYPCKFKDTQISPMAKIIAVADVYDAMTSHRVYQRALSPLVVRRELLKEMYGRLDSEACLALIASTEKALVGSLVELSDGAIAKVIYLNDPLVQPIVQTIDGRCIELERQKDLNIVDFIF
ncbi:MAG: HD-GYP domain-containing protein [Sporomusaceae bacterium]|nr:HD-GYP domain-containing protein [Sporomusaceae bacterium]